MSKQSSAFEYPSVLGNDEDNVDLEMLQARIDMSMSYVQDLVSTWIEPNKVITTSRSYDLEKELQEYMRRPPRLGVGASVPEEKNSTAREEARLKGRLRVKTKPKRSFDNVDKKESDSDEEQESKAGIIKKKSKFDPFAPIPQSNKKSKGHKSSRMILASQEGANEPLNLSGDVNGKPSSVKPAISRLQDAGVKGVDSMDCTAVKLLKLPALDRVTQASIAHVKQSSHNIEVPCASPLKVAVLNLDGPPPSEDDRTVTRTNSQSRKKKRKRRKKRNASDQDNERRGDTSVCVITFTDLGNRVESNRSMIQPGK